MPSVPRATDLASAIAAVNALQQMVTVLYGNIINTSPSAFASGSSSFNPGGGAAAPRATGGNAGGSVGGKAPPPPTTNKGPGSFQEVVPSRVTHTTRIYDPNNHAVYVDVKQITGLTFQDKLTGASWSWSQ
jgi:hypothetical protein